MALRAKKLYDSGLTLAEVGERCGGRSKDGMRGIFRARGWERRRQGGHIQRQLTLLMHKDYRELGTLAAVAEKYARTVGTISRRFANAELKVARPRGKELGRKAGCHPRKAHFAKGFCQMCYRRRYRKHNLLTPLAK